MSWKVAGKACGRKETQPTVSAAIPVFGRSSPSRRQNAGGRLSSAVSSSAPSSRQNLQKKKSRWWAFRSAFPCLRKRTSSASSAQNSLQKNSPLGARQGCNSPLMMGRCFPQNAQRDAAEVSHSFICCPLPPLRTPSRSVGCVPESLAPDSCQNDTHFEIKPAPITRSHLLFAGAPYAIEIYVEFCVHAGLAGVFV
jgi:hypothetical protein